LRKSRAAVETMTVILAEELRGRRSRSMPWQPADAPARGPRLTVLAARAEFRPARRRCRR
jgi:hypothetical protein